MSYEIQSFDKKLLDSTREQWLGDVAEYNLMPTEVEQIFFWAENRIDYTNDKNTEFSYGVFSQGSNVADAIVELVYSRLGSNNAWLKMLELRLRPQIYVSIENTEEIKVFHKVVEIFTACVVGVFSLTSERHKANIVKVYGRTPGLLQYLRLVASTLSNTLTNIDVTIEGRWLVFRIKSAMIKEEHLNG